MSSAISSIFGGGSDHNSRLLQIQQGQQAATLAALATAEQQSSQATQTEADSTSQAILDASNQNTAAITSQTQTASDEAEAQAAAQAKAAKDELDNLQSQGYQQLASAAAVQSQADMESAALKKPGRGRAILSYTSAAPPPSYQRSQSQTLGG